MSEPLDQLDALLRKLVAVNSDVIGAAIFSIKGTFISSVFASDLDEKRIATITATILSLIEREIPILNKLENQKKKILNEDTGEHLLVSRFGDNILIVYNKRDIRLNNIILDEKDIKIMEKAKDKIFLIMKKENLEILTIERKYLPELIDISLCHFFGNQLPNLDLNFQNYLKRNGIDIEIQRNVIKFINMKIS